MSSINLNKNKKQKKIILKIGKCKECNILCLLYKNKLCNLCENTVKNDNTQKCIFTDNSGDAIKTCRSNAKYNSKYCANHQQMEESKYHDIIYNKFKDSAIRLNKIFKITNKEFTKIISKKCCICFNYYSGNIIMIDEELGFIKKNVIPTCESCGDILMLSNCLDLDMQMKRFYNIYYNITNEDFYYNKIYSSLPKYSYLEYYKNIENKQQLVSEEDFISMVNKPCIVCNSIPVDNQHSNLIVHDSKNDNVKNIYCIHCIHIIKKYKIDKYQEYCEMLFKDDKN